MRCIGNAQFNDAPEHIAQLIEAQTKTPEDAARMVREARTTTSDKQQ